MGLDTFNALSEASAREKLLQACHSQRWADLMLSQRPIVSIESYMSFGERAWNSLAEADWLEAFAAHPEIGDVSTLKEKFQATRGMASSEQKGVNGADENTLSQLLRLNQEYKKKNGFIFIVFATGKSARQMLEILECRLGNSREAELRNAAREQWKITQLRLEQIL